MMRRVIVLILIVCTAVAAMTAKTPIRGNSKVDAHRMCEFVRQHNADFPMEIAEAFVTVAERYGIRAEIAFCQAIVETGWFKFTGGTAVTLEQNNFCGLGVTRLGRRGAKFDTVEDGVTAQMQHLFAYSCRHKLPKGEKLIDPRFALVKRGCAPHWEDLSGRWAANNNYGRDILNVYAKLKKFKPKKKKSKKKDKHDESADISPEWLTTVPDDYPVN